MMKKFNLSAASKALLTAGLLSLAVTGCGSDGDNGNDGQDGVIGVSIDNAKSMNAIFTNATVDAGTVTVDFKLENDNGVAVLGLTKDHDLRFGIAQLSHVTELMGETEVDRGFQWQAYINAEKTPNQDWIPEGETNIKPSNQFQANVEKASSCETCFVDNGDGTYSYSFQQNVANVTEPVAVAYNAEFTQRATLELELPNFAANAHFDWQPSTGMTDGIQTRNVVAIETCYTCHQPESLAFHGGRRIDLENCASCHTATSGDPETGNSVDFTYMIHAIHKGSNREINTPEGMAPAPYKVIGYGGGVHDYGKVMYPQNPAADCAACHVEGENAPANADLFKADLSNTACIGCHTEKPSSNHSSTNCMSCHDNGNEAYGRSAERAHSDATKRYKESQGYSAKFSNIEVSNNGTKDVLTFDVQILDEKDAPVAIELIKNPSQYTPSSIYLSWDIDKDYPAYTDETKYSARGFALLPPANPWDPVVSTYNPETHTFSINSTNSKLVLPALEGKSVELFAGVATCFSNGGFGAPLVKPIACDTTDDKGNSIASYAYIQDEPLRFTWNGTGVQDTKKPAIERRDIIDAAKCTSCHNQEIVHFDNGVNCQACHVPDKGVTEVKNEFYQSTGEIKSTSFIYKAHKAEGHYTGTVVKTDCMTCHSKGEGYSGPVYGFELGRSAGTAHALPKDLSQKIPEDIRNPENDADKEAKKLWIKENTWYASPDAAACMSCHQKYMSDAALSHMTTNGAYFGPEMSEAKKAVETCSTCHSPEQVMQLHGQ
ncbi:OmcA/MtrC family decaheme c-type cytochrome [Shewanella sp. 30m-9]